MKPQILIAGVAALALFSTAAFAQPQGGRAAIMQACGADFQKVCPGAQPGPGGGLRECVMANQSKLSDGCKTALAQMRAQHQQQGGGAQH